MPRIATATLQLATPYSQSRFHNTAKLSKELSDAYEERTWRNKMHVNEEGFVCIPALAFKNCIAEAAKYLSIQIPGKGKATYTKHFESGVLVVDDVALPVKAADVPCTEVFVPADGVRGSGKRVMKKYPLIKPGLEFDVEFHVYDSIIQPDVFKSVLVQAGMLIGIGTFRVRNNGTFGRFNVLDIKWIDTEQNQGREVA